MLCLIDSMIPSIDLAQYGISYVKNLSILESTIENIASGLKISTIFLQL